MSKIAHVAVGVVFNQAGEILVALRPHNKLQGGLWEFPGGKIETNETALQALKRELLEEVGITVEHADPLVDCGHHYEHHHVTLHVFQVRNFRGIAHGREGQQIDWVSVEKLLLLPLLAANHPIVEAILKTTRRFS
jgi:8-oxo-dGTP diphosphatase